MPQIKFNSIAAGGHILWETDKEVALQAVILREGVLQGVTDPAPVFRQYGFFKDFVHKLNGKPVLRHHSKLNQIASHESSHAIGYLRNVRARDDKKDAIGEAIFLKNKLTKAELEDIRNDKALDVSIEYNCPSVESPGKFNGKSFQYKEMPPYDFYALAVLPKGSGACSADDGCGLKLNNKFSRNFMSTVDNQYVEAEQELESSMRKFNQAKQNRDAARLEQAKAALETSQQLLARRGNPVVQVKLNTTGTIATEGEHVTNGMSRAEAEAVLHKNMKLNAAPANTFVFDTMSDQVAAIRKMKVALEQAGLPLTPEQQAILEMYPDLGAKEAAKQKAHAALRGKQ